jgi:hypothetical protein
VQNGHSRYIMVEGRWSSDGVRSVKEDHGHCVLAAVTRKRHPVLEATAVWAGIVTRTISRFEITKHRCIKPREDG